MIKSVIKSENGLALVFDEKGKEMPDYQGYFEKVRERILRDAPPDALFWREEAHRLKAIGKEEW